MPMVQVAIRKEIEPMLEPRRSVWKVFTEVAQNIDCRYNCFDDDRDDNWDQITLKL